MSTIVTNSQFQKKIGAYSKNIDKTNYIVVNRGNPQMVVLPYFDDNQDFIEDYLEAYEMHKNREKLKQELKNSLQSGDSDLMV